MEKRNFTRTDFRTRGSARIDSRVLPVSLLDISLKGVLVSVEEGSAIKHGETALLTIPLSGSEIEINAEGRCVHREGSHRGFRFVSIDADSLAHIRRLLELNTGEGDAIASELPFLAEEES